MIRAYVLQSEDDCTGVEALPFVQFAINFLNSDSMGIIRFMFVLGALMAALVDLLDEMHRVESAKTFVSGLHKTIDEARNNFQ